MEAVPLKRNVSIMGFDKYFYEDHCYMKISENDVPRNDEDKKGFKQLTPSLGDLISNVAENNTLLNSDIRYLQKSYNNLSNAESYTRAYPACKYYYYFSDYFTYCTEHTDMFLLEDEKLVKPGDKFDTNNHLIQYLNENAKRWRFYYTCKDSKRLNNDYEIYTYKCVLTENNYPNRNNRNLRKRNNIMRTKCPCKIKLRRLPYETKLTVIYVCNHHDHELSLELFNKMQHGRRLPPHVIEVVMDFISLNVKREIIRKYIRMETGFIMSSQFFLNLKQKMLKNNIKRLITEERLKFLNERIAAVGSFCDDNKDDIPKQNAKCCGQLDKNDRKKRKRSVNKKDSEKSNNMKQSPSAKKTFINELESCKDVTEQPQNENNINDTGRCATQINPWVTDNHAYALKNRAVLLNMDTSIQQTLQIDNLVHKIGIPDEYSQGIDDLQLKEAAEENEYYHISDVTDSFVNDNNEMQIAIQNIIHENEIVDKNTVVDNESLNCYNNFIKLDHNYVRKDSKQLESTKDASKIISINDRKYSLQNILADRDVRTSEDVINRDLQKPYSTLSNAEGNTKTNVQDICTPHRYFRICTDHNHMFLLEDEKLVKLGDKFETKNDLVQYLNENAKRWRFYYTCNDSKRLNNDYEIYKYKCVFFGTMFENKNNKFLRKRNNLIKTKCPCTIKLRRLPNETNLTVIYVCNHHDHELSLELYYKLQHGRRLPTHVKEAVTDFVSLKVQVEVIRKYVEMETGLTMSTKFFNNIKQKLHKNNSERLITQERLKFLNEKISAVENFGGGIKDLISKQSEKRGSQLDKNTRKKRKRSVNKKDSQNKKTTKKRKIS